MPRIDKALIEFKGTTLPVVTVSLRSLRGAALDAEAARLFGDDRFFDGDAGLLELSQLNDETTADWPQISALFAKHGLRIIGVRGGSEALRNDAERAGLPCLATIERAPRPTPASVPEAKPETTPESAPEPIAPAAEQASTAPPAATSSTTVPTRVVDRPLRSGQQVYARGGDLVVLAAVNAGAEVIADGSIHVYAPLRGRALAGASGDSTARIFTTRFEAELVSIAGVYRTFEAGVPGDLAGQPAQVQLVESRDEASGKTTSTLSVAALKVN